ncbi:MAG: hypothetical protein O7D33_04515 [Chloroflexi bacterium]|nr:hypothetical protein [Chloroflexota bacterium]
MSWIREDHTNIKGLSPVMTVVSINPKVLEALRAWNQSISFGSSALTRTQEEAIAATVSVINKCRY